MLIDPFNHQSYVDDVVKELKLSNTEIQKIHSKYANYGNQIFMIPITIWAEPTPYSPIRINTRLMRIYVPNKVKLVKAIRNLILQELGTTHFMNGFFPVFTETILRSHLYLPTPKNFNRENTYLAESKILRPIVTPDVDNVEKIVNDAIKSFVIYDDAQIVSNITEKYYSTRPRMEAVVYYNAVPLNSVHEKIIEQRKERWKQLLLTDQQQEFIQLLRKYYNT